MTGAEFKSFVEACGLQKDVARELGLQAKAVRSHYTDEEVPRIYQYAIFGLAMRMALTGDMAAMLASIKPVFDADDTDEPA